MFAAGQTGAMPNCSTRRRLIGTAGILAMLGGTIITGCGAPSAAKAPADEAKTKTGALELPVVSPTRETITRLIQQPGYVKAYEETPLYSNIAGFLDKINPAIDINKRVREGELLVQVRVPEREADLRSKEARIKQATAEVEQAKEGLHAAAANVETSTALVNEAIAGVTESESDVMRWKTEWDRAINLKEKRVYDQQSVDETRNQYQQAEASLERAKSRVKSARANLIESKAKESKAVADIDASKARVEVAVADKEYSAAMLAYRNITAPYDGVITKRNVDSGDFVQPTSSGSNNLGAKPLFVVMRLDKVRVTVQVPEFDGVLVQEGMPASVRFQALNDGDREFLGTVTRSTYSFDERARTLLVEIELPNTPKEELRPGMYANVTITSAIPNAWVLPNEALVSDEGGKMYCVCIENGKAVRTPVRVGTQTGKFTSVVKKQVKSGEKTEWVEFTGNEVIVSKNASSVTDGQEIRPQKLVAQSN